MASKRALMLVAIVALVALAVVAWLTRPRPAAMAVVEPARELASDGEDEATRPAEPIAVAAAREAIDGKIEAAAEPSYEIAESEEPRGRITGRVTGERDAPVAGATVRLSLRRGSVVVDLAELSTDRHGRYAITSAELAALDLVQLASTEVTAVALADGYAAAFESRFVVDEDARVLDLDLELRSGLTIVGRAVDASGRAAIGARVRLDVAGTLVRRPNAARCDSIGRFQVEQVAIRTTIQGRVSSWEPEHASVIIDHPSYGGRRVEVELGPRPSERVVDLGTVVLEPHARVSGRVVAADGTPLPGLAVEAMLVSDDGRRRFSSGGEWMLEESEGQVIVVSPNAPAVPSSFSVATTDALGRFEIAGLAPGRLRVTAHPPATTESISLGAHLASLECEGGASDLEIVAPGAWLVVRVTGADGSPLPGQEIEVGPLSESDGFHKPAVLRPWLTYALDSESATAAVRLDGAGRSAVRAVAGWAFDERAIEPLAADGAAAITLVLAPPAGEGRMRVRVQFPEDVGPQVYDVDLLSTLSRRKVAGYPSFQEDEHGWSPPLPAGTFDVEVSAPLAAYTVAPTLAGRVAVGPLSSPDLTVSMRRAEHEEK